MNRLQLITRVARRTGKNAASLDATTKDRLSDFVNEAHREILSEHGMDPLRQAVLTVSSVAGTQQYALPTHGVARINRIWDPTNRRKLTMKSLAWLRETDPDPQQGTPWAWIPVGTVEVHTQPSNASSVYLKSTSASDTGTAYIEGIRSGGYFRSVSVTMTGTTAVDVSATTADWVLITKVYLSTTAVGTVTLHEDSGSGTELARIAIGDVRAQYASFLLYGTPSAVVAYSVDITRAIPDMTQDTDEPLIWEDFHDLLIDMAEQKELLKGDDDSRYRKLAAHIQKRKQDHRNWVLNHPDWRPQWRTHPDVISALGAYYPADTVVG